MLKLSKKVLTLITVIFMCMCVYWLTAKIQHFNVNCIFTVTDFVELGHNLTTSACSLERHPSNHVHGRFKFSCTASIQVWLLSQFRLSESMQTSLSGKPSQHSHILFLSFSLIMLFAGGWQPTPFKPIKLSLPELSSLWELLSERSC